MDVESDHEFRNLATTLKETDIELIEQERERLHLDREKMERDTRDLIDERELRREESEALDKWELGKFKLMMDTITYTRK